MGKNNAQTGNLVTLLAYSLLLIAYGILFMKQYIATIQ